MIKIGNNTIGTLYISPSYSLNLIRGSKIEYFTFVNSDYPSNTSYSNTINSEGYHEVTLKALVAASNQQYRYSWVNNALTEYFQEGETYTLSADVKSDCAGFITIDSRASGNTNIKPINVDFTSTNGEWRRVSKTVKLTGLGGNTRSLLTIGFNNAPVDSTISFRKICLTKGTSAEWAPALTDEDGFNLLKSQCIRKSANIESIYNGVQINIQNKDTFFGIALDDGIKLTDYKGKKVTFSCFVEGLPNGLTYNFGIQGQNASMSVPINKNGLNTTVVTILNDIQESDINGDTYVLFDDTVRPKTYGDTFRITDICLTVGENINQVYIPAKSELSGTKISKVYKGGSLVHPYFRLPETDIALYDNVTGIEITVPTSKLNATDYPASRYTPIGIVVIPANISEELYPDGHENKGKPIIMSLKYMSCNTPDVGDNSQDIYYGGFGNNTPGIIQYQTVGTVENINIEESIISNSKAYLPSSSVAGEESKLAKKLYYKSPPYSVSPFIYKDTKYLPNSEFYTMSDYAQADMNGKGNTDALLERVTISNWKTSSSIENNWQTSFSFGKTYRYHPAACCCWRYHIDGVDNQGDWYLPSIGELCYMVPFLQEHQKAVNAINNVFGGSYPVLGHNQNNFAITLVSSSEVDTDSFWAITPISGMIRTSEKRSLGTKARAFRPLKVKL